MSVIAVMMFGIALAVTVPHFYTNQWVLNARHLQEVGGMSLLPVNARVTGDFVDNKRALFWKTNTTSNIQWQQVGPGWDINTPPTAEACDDWPDVSGCKPKVVLAPEQAGCNGSASEYTVEFRTLPKTRPATIFRMQEFVGTWCLPIIGCLRNTWGPVVYDGPEPEEQLFFRVTADTSYRTQGVNNYGAGDWTSRTLTDYCDNAPGLGGRVHID